jgi:asparagine synthase (glutamine-hydrolysing)
VASGVGLGHRLFRTSETQTTQPASLDGETWIAADARIDARDELVAALASAGVEARTGDAPSALILKAYAAWGEECVEHLLGDYSFALWDGFERKLFAARDLFGVKLFYYAIASGSFVFSNTLDSVRSHPAVSDRLNDVAIMDFLVAGLNQDLSATTFTDIRRIPPGHALSIGEGDTEPRIRRYRGFPSPPLLRHRSDRDYVEHFRTVFRSAVEDRVTTSELGLFMSGGLDSPGMAAVAQQVLADRRPSYDLRACTVVYDGLIEDEERHYAGLVGERLGIPIEFISADPYLPFDRWGTDELARPEPYDEPNLSCWVDEFRTLATHARVALYGEDPDTVLAPVPLKNEMRRGDPLGVVGQIARYRVANGRLPYLATGIAARLRRSTTPPEAAADGIDYPTWIAPGFERACRGRERYDRWWREPSLNGSPHAGPHAMLASPLWQSFLEALDPGVTGIPLEVRLPYLDERVVSFMLSLPSVPWRQKKYLVRVAFEGELPAEVLARPKAPLNGLFEARLLQWKDRSASLETIELDRLREYVDVGAFTRRLEPTAPTAWVDLRPLALAHWLSRLART